MKRIMPKAVVDTNVFVSGLLKGGTTLPVILTFRRGLFQLVTSDPLLDELFEVLSREKFRPFFDRSEIVELRLLIHQKAKIVETGKKIELCRDPKDNIVLECAVAAEANFIVTNDEDLLVLEEIEETRIVSSLSFLDFIEQRN